MTRILDGKRIAEDIANELKVDVDRLGQAGHGLHLAVVLVGEHPASASYVRGKRRLAERVGIASDLIALPADISEAALLGVVDGLNANVDVDGILVQLPLPVQISEQNVLQRIDPAKDVDGFHPENAGRAFVGLPAVWPCTPAGIMEMLRREDIDVAGKRAVVVGRSNIVGKPMAMLLLQANATVTICHSRTPDLVAAVREADVIVAAVGRPGLIGPDHVKPGAIVIDVGMNRVDGKLVGDVDYEGVFAQAGAITPVPGGVGPLTVAMLMRNTYQLGLLRRGLEV